jgi:NNMT/PNMT/TEMT family
MSGSTLMGNFPFDPTEYLSTYFERIMQDEQAVMRWLSARGRRYVADLRHRLNGAPLRMLDVGAGPTVHHMLSLVEHVDDVVLSDVLEANLLALHRWLDEDGSYTDWSDFAEATVRNDWEADGNRLLDDPLSVERQGYLRQARLRRITSAVVSIDLKHPLSAADLGQRFPLVTSFFCADSATDTKPTFAAMIKTLASFVEPGGLLFATFLGGCTSYRVGSTAAPSANLTERDIRDAIENAGLTTQELTRVNVPELAEDGFDHIYLTAAKRCAR